MNIEDPLTAAVFYVVLAGVFFVVLWQVVRSAVLSALRAHRREQADSGDGPGSDAQHSSEAS